MDEISELILALQREALAEWNVGPNTVEGLRLKVLAQDAVHRAVELVAPERVNWTTVQVDVTAVLKAFVKREMDRVEKAQEFLDARKRQLGLD